MVVVVVGSTGHNPSIQFAPIEIVTKGSLADPEPAQTCNVSLESINIGPMFTPSQFL